MKEESIWLDKIIKASRKDLRAAIDADFERIDELDDAAFGARMSEADVKNSILKLARLSAEAISQLPLALIAKAATYIMGERLGAAGLQRQLRAEFYDSVVGYMMSEGFHPQTISRKMTVPEGITQGDLDAVYLYAKKPFPRLARVIESMRLHQI